MQIEFHNVQDGREQNTLELTLPEAETVRGDLKITFAGAVPERYERTNVSVPLTVAEAKLFLARVKRHGHATWRLFFAPFLDGKLEKNAIRLMEGSRDHRSGKTIEVLSAGSIEELEKCLGDLERHYGRLSPTAQAVDAPDWNP
jgi:hypothetical protein